MKFAYFRKSPRSYEEIIKKVENEIIKHNLKLLGTTSLPNNRGQIFHICQENWLNNLINADENLFGFLPCSFLVLKKGKETIVGISDPSLLGKITDNPAVHEIAHQADKILKKLVNEIAGVGPLKVKEMKLYATMTCPYCKMEASWLEENKIKFRHLLVDLDQKSAEEMVRKTGQMGVPVTEIVYDNDEEEYIIGFDKQRLSEILGIDTH